MRFSALGVWARPWEWGEDLWHPAHCGLEWSVYQSAADGCLLDAFLWRHSDQRRLRETIPNLAAFSHPGGGGGHILVTGMWRFLHNLACFPCCYCYTHRWVCWEIDYSIIRPRMQLSHAISFSRLNIDDWICSAGTPQRWWVSTI